MSKPRSTHWTLRECLFSACAKSNRDNSQDERWLWAIREGMERLHSSTWEIGRAQAGGWR